MRVRALLLVVTALALVACGGEPAALTFDEALHLPTGDADAGRQAFLDLRCHSCHAVAGDDALSEPVAVARGPEIGSDQSGQSAAMIAESIIDPSHEIPPPRDSMTSPMGDFSETMTVRQLIDLIAYVQARAGS